MFALVPGVLLNQMGFTTSVTSPPAVFIEGIPVVATSTRMSAGSTGDISHFFNNYTDMATVGWSSWNTNNQPGAYVEATYATPFIPDSWLILGFSEDNGGLLQLQASLDGITWVILSTITYSNYSIPFGLDAGRQAPMQFAEVLNCTTAYGHYRYTNTVNSFDYCVTLFKHSPNTFYGNYIPNAVIPSTAQNSWVDPSYPLCSSSVGDIGADLSGTNNILIYTSLKVKQYSGGTNLLAVVPINVEYTQTQQFASLFQAKMYDNTLQNFSIWFTDDDGVPIDFHGAKWSIVLEFSFRAPDLLPLYQDQTESSIAQQELTSNDFLDGV